MSRQDGSQEPRHAPDLWRGIAEMGLLGIGIKDELGGGGGRVRDAGVVALALGEAGLELPYEAAMAAACWLAASASDPAALAVREQCTGSCFLLPVRDSGTALRTLGGATVVQDLTPAITSVTALVMSDSTDEEPVLSIVKHLELGPEVSTTARGHFRALPERVSLGHGTEVSRGPAAYRGWRALRSLFQTLSVVRLAGCGRWLLDTADAYSRVRSQFGHAIGSYQSLQHVLVDMLAAVEATELLGFDALLEWEQEQGGDDSSAVAAAFARRSIPETLQDAYAVLGGVGFMEEHPISGYARMALPLITGLGTGAELNERAGTKIRRNQWV